MLDQAEYAAANKSRQIGFSHTTAGVGVLWGAFHGELTTVISVGDREAKEVLEKAKGHRNILVELGSQLAVKGRFDSAEGFQFASGGRVLALPASGGRSFTGNVFLDEYAYQQHAAKVWDAAMAVTLLGFRARVASTPNGVGNEFHNLITSKQANEGWSIHTIPIHDAIAQGFPVDIKKCWKIAKGDPRIFRQLFECSFLDGLLQYIPTEHVVAALEERPVNCSGWVFAGLDIGRSADRTELYAIQGGPDGRYHVVYHQTCKRTADDDLDRIVEELWGRYDVRRLCIDSTGLGIFPAERLQKRYGRARVEPITFTLQSKEEMATGLYSIFCGDKIRIPKADHQLFEDVCSIQREITDSANVRYTAPHTDKGHADSAWALGLAVLAASKQRSSNSQGHSGV